MHFPYFCWSIFFWAVIPLLPSVLKAAEYSFSLLLSNITPSCKFSWTHKKRVRGCYHGLNRSKFLLLRYWIIDAKICLFYFSSFSFLCCCFFFNLANLLPTVTAEEHPNSVNRSSSAEHPSTVNSSSPAEEHTQSPGIFGENLLLLFIVIPVMLLGLSTDFPHLFEDMNVTGNTWAQRSHYEHREVINIKSSFRAAFLPAIHNFEKGLQLQRLECLLIYSNYQAVYDLNFTSVKLKKKKEPVAKLFQQAEFPVPSVLWDVAWQLASVMDLSRASSTNHSWFPELGCVYTCHPWLLHTNFPFFLLANLLPAPPNEKSNTLNSSSPKKEPNQFPIFFGKN